MERVPWSTHVFWYRALTSFSLCPFHTPARLSSLASNTWVARPWRTRLVAKRTRPRTVHWKNSSISSGVAVMYHRKAGSPPFAVTGLKQHAQLCAFVRKLVSLRGAVRWQGARVCLRVTWDSCPAVGAEDHLPSHLGRLCARSMGVINTVPGAKRHLYCLARTRCPGRRVGCGVGHGTSTGLPGPVGRSTRVALS